MTSTARIAVERRGEASVIAALSSSPPVGLRPLPPIGALARVALVQTSACLVAGDDVALEVHVGPGAGLEIVEISATLAHPVPATRPPITQVLRVHLRDGARLLWLAQPLVLSAGTRLHRRLDVAIAASSRALLGETVVFGRDGEDAGDATTRIRISRDGRAVLDDRLATADPSVLRSPAVAGAARVCAALTLVGVEPPAPPAAGALQLGPRDTTLRCLGARAADTHARVAPVASSWRRALLCAAEAERPAQAVESRFSSAAA